MAILTTTWLGQTLAHPLIAGASPLVDDLDTVRRLEDAGAAAITMHSLFEEQLVSEQLAMHRHVDGWRGMNAEAADWLPGTADFLLGPDQYLEQLRKVREAVKVPVIGSLNGSTPGGWLAYAKLMEQAGAHALELNLYALPSDPARSAGEVEEEQLSIVRQVVASVRVPVGVKLSPFYSSLPHFAARLAGAGVSGLVLFNRLYQPDVNPEALEVDRVLKLSDASELTLRLRWLAILSAHVQVSFAVSGGVHDGRGAVKALMAGASAVQVVSALLQHGPGRLKQLKDELTSWLHEHEYVSVQQLVGSMNLARVPDPSAYERANYVKLLQGWHKR